MRRLLCVLAVLMLGCAEVSAQENNDNSFYALNFSFYHSEGVLERENYSFNHVGLDLEKNWSKNKIGLSGWTLGYRKEEIDKKNFGHFVNFGVFRRVGIGAGFYIKPSIRFEWGLPSDRLDHTVFHEDGSYAYVYLLRNSNLPKEINRGFFFWPVAEVKVGKTVSVFVFEAGIRGGYSEIGVEKYYPFERDFELSKRWIIIPSAVVTIGFKM